MRPLIAAAALAALLAACGETPTSEKAAGGATTATVEGEGPATGAPATQPPADGAPPPGPPPPAEGAQGGTDQWRQVVSTADASNLGRLHQAWRLARAEAEDKGFADEVEALGPLVDPNAAQSGNLQPPPGAYRCRTVKLGSQSEAGLAYVAYPFFRCMIELTPGGDLVLTKTTGSQRARGLLYPDTDRRLVFVGAQAWGMDEVGFPRYGQQPIRDQVGVFERIGASRWRLVVPWPRVESKLEILELVR
jgi:hypothetical protein